jgi:hypothetical protein
MGIVVHNFDLSGVMKKLNRLNVEAKAPLDALMQETGRLFVSSSGKVPGMVQVIPPSHQGVTGPAAGKHGEMVVRRDISRVYATPGRIYAEIAKTDAGAAKGFWAAIKDKSVTTKARSNKALGRRQDNLSTAQGIIRSAGGQYNNIQIISFDGGTAHRSARNGLGRVTKDAPGLMVSDPKALAHYVKMRVGNVGLLGSVMNQPAELLGAKGVPRFIKRHGSKFGTAQILSTPRSFYIQFNLASFGEVQYLHRVPYVILYCQNRLERQWPYVKKYIIAQAQLKAA